MQLLVAIQMNYKKFKSVPLGKRSDQDLKRITTRTLKKDIELLNQQLTDELARYNSWKINRPKYLQYKQNFDKLYTAEVLPLKREIEVLKKERSNYKVVLGLFKSSKLTDTAKLQLSKLEDFAKQKELNIKNRLGEVAYCSEVYNTHLITGLQNQISRYQTFLQKKLKKEEQLDIAKGLAATVTKKSRDLADEIKYKIHKNEYCPYCGDKLLDNCHADHIYPISKGGLSVPKNMVYVCGTCNIKKGSMTLTSFIKKYKLNRDYIEANLEMLNKDF